MFLLAVFRFGLFLLELFLELGQAAVFQFCGPVQVILLLGLFNLGVEGFQLFPELLHLADGSLFVLPTWPSGS